MKRVRDYFKSFKGHPFSLFLRLAMCLAVATCFGIFVYLVVFVAIRGIPHLNLEMFSLKYTTDNLSMMPAIINTLTLAAMSLLLALPLGIFAAIYLTEYAKSNSMLVKIIRLTTETLSGIPSIVYGLFGYIVFVVTLDWSFSLLGGAITMAIMVLPLIIRTTEEAILSVPIALREGSYGLGAGRLRTISKIILPASIQGIFAGIILSVGRIVGETAALIYTFGTHSQIATSVESSGRTLAVHMWALFSEGHNTDAAYAAGVVLLALVVIINAISYKIQRKLTSKNK